MKRKACFVLLNLLLLTIALPCRSQQRLWSGVISPGRAVDWSQAGVSGGVPVRTTICKTVSLASGSASASSNSSAIQSAIAACSGSNAVVSIPAGTWYVAGISFGTANNVTVRGQGANSTFLVFTSGTSCSIPADVCFQGGNNSAGGEQNVCDWTAGYSQGATSLTLSNCGSATPAKGSISNLHVGSVLMLDQVDEAQDTGTIWNCAANSGSNACATNTQAGFDRTNGGSVSGISIRSQVQTVMVTSISGSGPWTVGISPGLFMPNWRSTQLPQAWYSSQVGVTGDGLEDVSLDNTSAATAAIVAFFNVANDWLSGVRGLYGGRDHVEIQYSYGVTVQHSYFYQSQSHNTVSYTVEQIDSGNSLIQNIICQQVTDSCPNTGGSSEGNVAAYNFAVDDVYNSSGWFQASLYQHASGDAFGLWEGNIGPGYTSDDVHGTHHFETLFRNHLLGNQAAGCGSASASTCTGQTIPIQGYAGSRYMNIVGNVLGQPGYHKSYQCIGTSGNCSGGITSIYEFGATGNNGGVSSALSGFCLTPACTARGPYDPLTLSYSFRWGNYDVVTNGVRWCGDSSNTGYSTMCSSGSEVPADIASYANALPTLGDTSSGQGALPVSFYNGLTQAYPSCGTGLDWWKNPTTGTCPPFPAIGPDVTNGNLGICTSGTYAGSLALTASQCAGGSFTASAWGGHANATPAMVCYLNVMGGPPNGTGGALAFDRASCYGSDSSTTKTTPQPPTGLTTTVTP